MYSREEVNAYNRKWNSENPEVYRNKSRRTRKERPQYYIDIEERYRKKQIATGGKRAKSRTWYRVKIGELKRLSAEFVACVDCGARASCYDHRDYNKPLDVDPVCRSCNYKRGPAISEKD